MTGKTKLFSNAIIIGFSLLFLLCSGCKGSDSREEVDNTVEEFAGKKKVDQMKALEKNIGEIRDQQSDRLENLNQTEDER